MGRRGPKPEPATVKAAKGNPGRRPLGADEVAATQSEEAGEKASLPVIVPPPFLKKTGLKVWQRMAPRLIQMKLLSPVDAEPFGRYCQAFARWERMQKVLDKEGETYESESAHGKLKRVHPAFLIADRLERQLLAFEDRFGINPAERQRLYAARASQPAFPGELPFGLPPAPARGGSQRGASRQASPSSPVGFLN